MGDRERYRARCRTCGADIMWARTRDDKKMPINFEPVGTGNILLAERRPGGGRGRPYLIAHVMTDEELRRINDMRRNGEQTRTRYLAHFTTCKRWI